VTRPADVVLVTVPHDDALNHDLKSAPAGWPVIVVVGIVTVVFEQPPVTLHETVTENVDTTPLRVDVLAGEIETVAEPAASAGEAGTTKDVTSTAMAATAAITPRPTCAHATAWDWANRSRIAAVCIRIFPSRRRGITERTADPPVDSPMIGTLGENLSGEHRPATPSGRRNENVF